MIYLLLYVDDMLIASKSKVEIDRFKAQLSQEFEMKDLGDTKKKYRYGDQETQSERYNLIDSVLVPEKSSIEILHGWIS